MAPEGPVMLEETVFSAAHSVAGREPSTPATASGRGCMAQVERFFLDRCPVTNRQYHAFVADGGYRQQSLWDQAAWARVAALVDLSGAPGPHYWNNGRFAPGEEDLPVVGVSWHEAAAYARWAGKRLPTDAEWVKAASWPVAVATGQCRQRRYPWGDAMEPRRANLWGYGPNCLVPVGEFPEGISVGGVSQLIGNVWEWIDGEIGGGAASLRSIRGGAFDTFFDDSRAGPVSKRRGLLESPPQHRHPLRRRRRRPHPFPEHVMTETPGDLPEAGGPEERGDPRVAGHAAHHRFAKSGPAPARQAAPTAPAQILHPDSPQVRERLEALDDAVYEAIDGRETALERLTKLWPATLAELGPQLVAESREQYLRYALSIWETCADAHGVHDPCRSVQALDVLCVLFDEEA